MAGACTETEVKSKYSVGKPEGEQEQESQFRLTDEASLELDTNTCVEGEYSVLKPREGLKVPAVAEGVKSTSAQPEIPTISPEYADYYRALGEVAESSKELGTKMQKDLARATMQSWGLESNDASFGRFVGELESRVQGLEKARDVATENGEKSGFWKASDQLDEAKPVLELAEYARTGGLGEVYAPKMKKQVRALETAADQLKGIREKLFNNHVNTSNYEEAYSEALGVRGDGIAALRSLEEKKGDKIYKTAEVARFARQLFETEKAFLDRYILDSYILDSYIVDSYIVDHYNDEGKSTKQARVYRQALTDVENASSQYLVDQLNDPSKSLSNSLNPMLAMLSAGLGNDVKSIKLKHNETEMGRKVFQQAIGEVSRAANTYATLPESRLLQWGSK